MELYPTRHCVETMAERGISWAEILQIFAQPDVTYGGSTGPHADKNSTTYQRGELFAIIANTPEYSRHDSAKQFPMHAVLTTGLRSTKQWTNGDVRSRSTTQKGKP